MLAESGDDTDALNHRTSEGQPITRDGTSHNYNNTPPGGEYAPSRSAVASLLLLPRQLIRSRTRCLQHTGHMDVGSSFGHAPGVASACS